MSSTRSGVSAEQWIVALVLDGRVRSALHRHVALRAGHAAIRRIRDVSAPPDGLGRGVLVRHSPRRACVRGARNFSVHAIPQKLTMLGLLYPPPPIVKLVVALYALVLVLLAWRAGRRPVSRAANLVACLSLLNLGALISPAAPSAYVGAPMLWTLALLTTAVRGRFGAGAAIAVAWVLLIGPPPLSNTADLVLGLMGQGIAIALGLGLLMRYPPADASAVRAGGAQAPVAYAR